MVEGLTLPIIIGAAAVDSINPCVIGVLVFLLVYLRKAFPTPLRLLVGSIVYITTVYVTYFLLGLGVLHVLGEFSKPFYWFAASIALIAGALEIKDYFRYGWGFSLQIFPSESKRLEYYITSLEHFTEKHFLWLLAFMIPLGIFVTMVELPCTGAPYFAILGLLAQGDLAEGIPLLLLYNLVFIAPLIFITFLFLIGVSTKRMEKWKEKNRALLKLIIGLFLLGLGIYMIYSVI